MLKDAANAIEELVTECNRLQVELDAAKADIPHTCETCARNEDDTECAHCYGNADSWNTYEDCFEWSGETEWIG